MSPEHVLAIDEGTTGVRAFIVHASGEVRGTAYRQIDTRCPGPGLVEHDVEDIWQATLHVIRAALAAAGLDARDLAAIGIAVQRATVVLWDASRGRPTHTALSWQDHRTATRCDELLDRGHFVMPLQSATKVEWLLADATRAGISTADLRAGTIDSWLVWKLTGGRVHVTDPSNASCTGLYDYFEGTWQGSLLDVLGIPETLMARIEPSSALYGHTDAAVLGAEIPVAGIAGDQQAAMFGQLCVEPGAMKATFGTSAMFNVHAGQQFAMPAPGTYPLVLWEIDGERAYCLEGSAITAGAAIQWLADSLHLIERPEDSHALALSVSDSGGAWAVPAFQGLGTPHMLLGARAVLGGLSRATSRAHVVRALLEGVAFRGREVFEALAACESVPAPSVLRVDGGAARNDFLMQTQADVLGLPVERPETVDAGAIGAAYLAGRAVGMWRDLEALEKTRRVDRVFEPRWSTADREERWAQWQQRIQTTIAAAN